MTAVRDNPNWCAVAAYCSGTGRRGWKRVPNASKVRRRVREDAGIRRPADPAIFFLEESDLKRDLALVGTRDVGDVELPQRLAPLFC